MSLISLFKTKSPEVPAVSVMEPEVNIATLFILSMEMMLQQAQEQSGALVPVIGDIRSAYAGLVKCGLQNSQNGALLKKEIDDADKIESDKRHATAIIEFIKWMRNTFGERTILVPEDEFKKICAKYKLVTGPLCDYNGVIPERNIADITIAISKLEQDAKFPVNDIDNWLFKDANYMYVQRIENVNEYCLKKVPEFMRTHRIVRLRKGEKLWGDSISAEKTGSPYFGEYARLYGVAIDRTSMFIACPEKYLNNPHLKITTQPVDPIVYQYTHFGIMIHTMWGEEAEDKVLQEYAKPNGLIAEI